MSDQLVREIAQQIVQEGLLHNWLFYALLLALLVISTTASALLTGYIRKRSETYATKADLAELVRQLRETTRAAEEVKTAIGHADWTAKEWKTLRRLKLEELVDAIHSTQHWLELVGNEKLYESKVDPGPSPLPKAIRIARLYFPELAKEVSAFDDACRSYRMWMLSLQGQVLDAGNDMAQRRKLHEAAKPEMTRVYRATLDTASAIETNAAALMKEIVGAANYVFQRTYSRYARIRR